MIADDAPLPAGARRAAVVRLRDGRRSDEVDWITEEVPVALEFNGIAHAVMLATPADLEDFALGFGLSEGIFDAPSDLHDCEIEAGADGLTVRMDVSARSFARLKLRRRNLAGRTGCGLCGVESLAQAMRPPPVVAVGDAVACRAIGRAMDAMRDRQRLCRATGSTHAAAWCSGDGAACIVREDVGRHNALDKLVGAMARAGVDPRRGFVAVTSRASVEMVQKAAVAGAPLLAAVSAPTLLAIETAERAGMCLVGMARQCNLVAYAHPQRLLLDPGD